MIRLNYVDAVFTSLSYAVIPFEIQDRELFRYIDYLKENDMYDDDFLENVKGVHFYIVRDLENRKNYISSSYEIGTSFDDDLLDQEITSMMICDAGVGTEISIAC